MQESPGHSVSADTVPPGETGTESVDASASHLDSAPDPPAAPTPDSEDAGLLRSRDQRVVAVLAGCTLILLAVHWLRLTSGGSDIIEVRHQSPLRYDYRIDINTAGVIEWYQLDGIGESLAERIVLDRQQNGPFRSVEDLQRVKGIGPATVGKLQPWVKASDSADVEPESRRP